MTAPSDPMEGFARRWSRRKRGAPEQGATRSRRAVPSMPALAPEEDESVEAEAANAPDAIAPAIGEDHAALSEGQSDADGAPPPETPEQAAERLGLPDPATLTAESDFSVFMGDKVPEALQRLALRRLWRLHPLYSLLDGLNDYDDDFTLEVVEGVVQTIYKVGKGMVTDDEEEEGDGAPEGPAETLPSATVDRLDAPRPPEVAAGPVEIKVRVRARESCEDDVGDAE